MISKEWREWFVRNPFGTDSGTIIADLAALESFCDGLQGINDKLRAEHNEDNMKLAAMERLAIGGEGEAHFYYKDLAEDAVKRCADERSRAERAEKERDEWKGMASRGATANVEYMALMEQARDRAESEALAPYYPCDYCDDEGNATLCKWLYWWIFVEPFWRRKP